MHRSLRSPLTLPFFHCSALREIIKNLNSSLSSAQASANLPPTIEQSIQSTLDKDPKVDDQAAQRLQEDLLAIYNRHVASAETKLGAFLQALVHLEPYVKGQSRKQEWWKLAIKPVLDGFGRRRVEIERASDFMLHVLNYDEEEDHDGSAARQSAHFTHIVLEGYLEHTNAGDVEADEYSLESEHIASQYEHVLVGFGRKKPKDFIVALDKLVMQAKYRGQALSLLSAFLRGQPPHLDLVSQTSLIEHLLQCLMIDSSSTVVQLAMTVLIMFLPHVPSSIKQHLPRLFLIYSRLLCWDQVAKPHADEEYFSPDEERPQPLEEIKSDQSDDAVSGWAKLEGSAGEDATSLDVSYYFTFMYGLYPLNFTNYIKKPRRYLKDINFPRADQLQLDQDAIRHRTEPLRAIHLLHPNFYNTTPEEELEDDRWLISDAADVVADCISLRVSLLANSTQQPPGPPPASQLPETPLDGPYRGLTSGEEESSMTSDSIRSSTASGTSGLSRSRTTSKRPPRRPSRPPTGLDPGDSPTLPPAEGPRRSSTSSFRDSSPDPTRALLKQQLALLRNDLNFERYLKQQHLIHIGQLQRLHISDATVSANVENLKNTNKSLKSKLTKANDAYTALKKETATGRTQSKKFEADLSSKVRGLRDAERTWHSEESALKLELEQAHSDGEALQRLVVEAESRELLSRQKIASMELEVETVHALQVQVLELQEQLRLHERKEFELDRTTDTTDSLRMDLASTRMQLQAKDGALDHMRRAYERRISELETELAAAASNPSNASDGISAERRQRLQDAIDRAVGSIKLRLTAAQTELAQMKRKHTELDIQNAALKSDVENLRGGFGTVQEDTGTRSIPVPRRTSTAPLGVGGHWRNSTGTPTDTDEASTSPARPPRPARAETVAAPHGLRRTSRAAANALAGAAAATRTEDSSTPLSGPSSAPAKHPPMPVGTTLTSPRQPTFPLRPGDTPDSDAAVGSGGSSAPTGSGQGLYLNKKSAWSIDSFDSGRTGESGKTKASGKSGKSSGSGLLFAMGSAKKTEGEAEEERKRREKLRRQPPKTGGLRGLKGLI
ncbi:MAG: hypothetical protein Q9162_001112 [Coniocarpon cinnabarinum]